eukprot:7020675-Pyramimonas_sp.AAC.1
MWRCAQGTVMLQKKYGVFDYGVAVSAPPTCNASRCSGCLSVRCPWHPASAAVGWVYNMVGKACRHKVLTSDARALAT